MIHPILLKITLTANCFKRFNLFKLNIFFKRAKFTLDFKTNIQTFLCFEIKGVFRSFEINISFKKV